MDTQPKLQKDLDFSVDINKVIQKLLVYKWYFLVSLIIAAIIAWYVGAKTVPVYIVRASLLIKVPESKGQSGASVGALLYGSEMLGSGKKLSNEIAQMQSSPFIKTIISRMNLRVLYAVEGQFYKIPLYKNNPFEILVLADSIEQYESYAIKFNNENSYTLLQENYTTGLFDEVADFKFNDTLTINKSPFIVKKNPNFNSKDNKDKLYYFVINTSETIAGFFRSMLDIRQQAKDASIVNLSLSTQIPSREIDFLNQFMAEYVRYGLEDKTKEATKTISFINKQLEAITDSLSRVEGSLEAFKVRTKTSEAGNPAGEFYTQLFSIAEQKNNLLLLDQYLTYLEDYVKANKDIQKEKLVVPSVMNMAAAGGLETTIQRLIELQIEKNTYLNGGASKNPALKDINSQIEQLRTALLENINNLRQSNRITVKNADDRMKDIENKISVIPKSEREMVNIKRLFTLNENIYLLLLEKRLEAEIARASATEDAKVVEPAACDSIPTAPKKRNNYLIALILGLVIPLIAVLLREYFKSVLRNQADLERLSSIPIFGTIPHHSAAKATPMTIIERPKSRISESFRSLRSNLTFFTNLQATNNTFLFTSSISGEGKSFCSASFALVLASTGKKTLLIVTDLRKPKFYLGDINITDYQNGLSSLLIGAVTVAEAIQKSTVDNLDFIPPGALPPNPAELLTRQIFADTLNDLKKQYDYIVIDSAPIGLVSDAMGIMPYVDVILYVVKQNYTPFLYISHLQEMYEDKKVKNIGFLLNDVKIETQGYGYGYGAYGYGYGYYEEEQQSWWQKLNKKLWRKNKT